MVLESVYYRFMRRSGIDRGQAGHNLRAARRMTTGARRRSAPSVKKLEPNLPSLSGVLKANSYKVSTTKGLLALFHLPRVDHSLHVLGQRVRPACVRRVDRAEGDQDVPGEGYGHTIEG